jgi:hypothetical protein
MLKKLETSNRALAIAFALTAALSGAACSGKHEAVTVQNEEEVGAKLLSTVRMGDTKADSQLLSGFYNVENGWRWTAGKFTTILKTPLGASQRGAILSLDFTIPEVISQKLKDITLTASINGMALKSSAYKEPGKYTYTADVPASMLTADTVKVDFALDKSLPPGVDRRELGVIATSVGIASK